MNYLKFSFGILLVLAASRLIPHPPNFTSLIALSFYVPAFLGRKYIPALISCFLITDFIIGFHNTILFTWGSVFIIGLFSKYFLRDISSRIAGTVVGVIIFFIITNFGVWLTGLYSFDFKGLISCYILALPFLGNTFVSTILFSFIIELLNSIYQKFFLKVNNKKAVN
jgi:hypothetical protein